jgi:hypothetical protein
MKTSGISILITWLSGLLGVDQPLLFLSALAAEFD